MVIGPQQRLANWLNTTMQARRMSQADLARSLGVADAQVSRWRRGQVMPSVYYLQRIADTFGVQRATLETLAGYPMAEAVRASLPEFEIDPAAQAELEAHQARLREILIDQLPRGMWASYMDACEALADSLRASVRLNVSLRDMLRPQPDPDPDAPPERSTRPALGFRTYSSPKGNEDGRKEEPRA